MERNRRYNKNYKKRIFNRRRLKVVLGFLTVSLAILMFSGTVFDVLGIFGNDKVLVDIPKGSTVRQIAKILDDDGIISHPKVFILLAKGKNKVYQSGYHNLTTGMSYSEIRNKLSQVPDGGYDDIVKMVVPEGYETRQIAERAEELGLADKDKFMDELENGKFDYDFVKKIERKENRLEGYLFPATYEIIKGESAHSIIDRMLKKFNEVAVPMYNKSGSDLSLDEIVIMASIVEREAANDSERGNIASVFYNRIEKDMTLSSCATVQYILKDRKAVLSNSDVKIKSPYNTYIKKGLPIGPIASPGENSIKAALYPSKTEYLYFAAVSDGSANVFSKTDEEHMAKVKEIQGK